MKRDDNSDVKRKARLTDGIVDETPGGYWMRCTCATAPEACTLHNEEALEKWRMAMAVRRAIAAGVMPEVSGTLQ